jgi:hypothetical protein
MLICLQLFVEHLEYQQIAEKLLFEEIPLFVLKVKEQNT